MFEKFMFKKVEMWLVGLVVMLMLGLAFVVGVAVHHKMAGGKRLGGAGDVLMTLVTAPQQIKTILTAGTLPSPMAALEQRFDGQPDLIVNDTDPAAAYLLYSRFDQVLGRTVVDLIDLRDHTVRHRWVSDMNRYLADHLPVETYTVGQVFALTPDLFIMGHPLLMADGSLTFKAHLTPTVQVDLCNNVNWVNADEDYHHAAELDADGNMWTLGMAVKGVRTYNDYPYLPETIVKLSPAGQRLYTKNLMDLLQQVELEPLVTGLGAVRERDVMHGNDVQPVLEDGPHWQKGDLFISLRNLALILLYRPSTDEVIWHKIGPWVSQHDVDILDDHRISIFSNEARGKAFAETSVTGSNKIFIYDFATGKAETYLQAAFERHGIRTLEEGLSDFLPDGSLMVEESQMGRLLALNPDGSVKWQRVNRGADGQVYRLSWSRPVSRDLGDQVMATLAATTCPAP